MKPTERQAAKKLRDLGFEVVRLNRRERAAVTAAWKAYGSPGTDPAAQAAAQQRYQAAYAAAMKGKK